MGQEKPPKERDLALRPINVVCHGYYSTGTPRGTLNLETGNEIHQFLRAALSVDCRSGPVPTRRMGGSVRILHMGNFVVKASGAATRRRPRH